MVVTAYHDPGFAAPLGNHRMPIGKFDRVAEGLRGDPAFILTPPPPASLEALLRVHTPHYVAAVRSGHPRELAESQKFPWSEALFPSVALTNGGVIAAARMALRQGVSATIASGFHHAHADHGEGFCTFNGLVIAGEALRAAGEAERIAVLDLDLHYGNGTASLAETRPWLRALSIYGNDYRNNIPYRDVSTRHHEDGLNHRSVALPEASGLSHLRSVLETELPWLIQEGKPDLLLYQAGADPFREDPYSPLDLSIDDLKERDFQVFQWAHQHRIPIAWVLAGGYTRDLEKVVRIHLNTFEAAKQIYA